MKPRKTHRLGELQLKIMKILWARAEVSVGEVHKALAEDLAYVTVATMLRKMEVMSRGDSCSRLGSFRPLRNERQ